MLIVRCVDWEDLEAEDQVPTLVFRNPNPKPPWDVIHSWSSHIRAILGVNIQSDFVEPVFGLVSQMLIITQNRMPLGSIPRGNTSQNSISNRNLNHNHNLNHNCNPDPNPNIVKCYRITFGVWSL